MSTTQKPENMNLFEDSNSNLDILPLSSRSFGTYSRIRRENKSGVCSSLIILLRATTGLGLLTNQFYFILNGFILSPLIIITLFFCVGICISLMLSVCNDIEYKNEHIVERYEDIMMHLPLSNKLKKGLYMFTKV